MGCNSDTIETPSKNGERRSPSELFLQSSITRISKPDQVRQNRNLACIKSTSINILSENIQYFLKIHYDDAILGLC